MSNRDSDDVQLQQDSEDDFDWEEVEVPLHREEEKHFEITIQISSSSSKKKQVSKNKGISHAERQLRIACHKIHTITLLLNASTRNKWMNDELLHARLLSLTPMSIQNAFSLIHKSRVPDQAQRGRMFEAAVTNLVTWWSSEFFEVTITGHIRNRTYEAVQSRLDFLRAQSSLGNKDGIEEGEDLDMDQVYEVLEIEPEVIRSPNSLMKHALMQTGSRDTSAQLFTALCRALGIPARLVVSLQSVPWQTNVGKPKPTYKRPPNGKGKEKGKEKEKEKAAADEDESEDEGMEEVDIHSRLSDVKGEGKANDEFPGNGQRLDGSPLVKSAKAKGKEKARPLVKLRKQKDKGRVLGGPSPSSASASSSRFASPLPSTRTDPTTTPPVFWTEVFSRPDSMWIPVDSIRAIVNKRKVFDPTPITNFNSSNPASNLPNTGSLFPPRSGTSTPRAGGAGSKTVQDNRMLYVLAFEEDGYARDVTRRYAREYSAKVLKAQGGSSAPIYGGGGQGRMQWWERVVGCVGRPYRLHRDDVEDEELDRAQYKEPMPSTIAGFKDHPLYVLTRHLKQTETLYPSPPSSHTPELGKFRGESVYPRSSVVSLKTAENWMRSEGRSVKEGEQPLKMTKVRAGTVNRMRELEVLKEAGAGDEGDGEGGGKKGGEVMQGLYARFQTEPYIPPPVVDGVVPKNNFGNVDLYVPEMVPAGGVHVPFKGTAKIAKKLGIDYAEAVTGFEFKKRRAFPVIEGVVVAKENEATLLEAYLEAEEQAAQKARAKREERVIKLWTKLIQGLRIRKRLREQYASKDGDIGEVGEEGTEGAEEGAGGGGFVKENKVKQIAILGMSRQAQGPSAYSGGGFFTCADDVVQPYDLPKAKFQAEFQEGTPTLEPALLPEEEEREAVQRADQETDELMAATEQAVGEFDPLALGGEDEEMEEVEVTEPIQPVVNVFVPKTMQELAEDAANRRKEGEIGNVVETFGDAAANGVASNSRINESTRKGKTPRNTRASGTSTPAITIVPANAGVNGRGKGKRNITSATRRERTAQKRKWGEDDEDDEGSVLSSADDDYAGTEHADQQEGGEQEEQTPSPSPSKRPRRSTRKDLNYRELDAPAISSTTGRSLRPRKLKS